mmetsp:Transcript_1966/g.7740  ORF Transcript_1966/g.7740 Transcript_1966/m.7740 type:complete len:500 (-) Transcript_1966:3285-4784(-)
MTFEDGIGSTLKGWGGIEGDLRWNYFAGACAAVVGVGLTGWVVKEWYRTRWWEKHLRKVDGSRPDGPPRSLLLGNVPQLSRAFYKTLYQYIDRESSVFWILSTPFVVVTDPDSVRRVLGGDGGVYSKPKYFGYRSKAVKTAVASQQKAAESETAQLDETGDVSRRALGQLAQDKFKVILAGMGELLSRLEGLTIKDMASDDDAVIGIVQSGITRLNLQVLFEYSDSRLADDIGMRILHAGREFAQEMVNPLGFLFRPLALARFLFDAIAIIRFGRALGRHLDHLASTGAKGWVHAWIGKVGKVGKLGKVTGLVMASTQTVPTATLWLLYYLSEHPRELEKIRAELRQILGERMISEMSYDDLKPMVYAESVVRETLRLRPPFPVLVKECQRDDDLAGLRIPSGTSVYIVPWLVHQNTKSWEEPEKFRPERFLNAPESGGAPSSFAYLPFSRGSRMCGGYRLAIMELKIFVARFAYQYDCKTSFPPSFEPVSNPQTIRRR